MVMNNANMKSQSLPSLTPLDFICAESKEYNNARTDSNKQNNDQIAMETDPFINLPSASTTAINVTKPYFTFFLIGSILQLIKIGHA